jgi:hypothetical protein
LDLHLNVVSERSQEKKTWVPICRELEKKKFLNKEDIWETIYIKLEKKSLE